MSNQLQTFAVTDASTQALKTMWYSKNIDEEVFFPALRGTSPYTLPFYRRVNPMTAPAFGQTAQFNLDNAGDWVTQMVLELQLSQIVPTVGGAAVSYKNDITAACIDNVQLFQGGTLLQRIANDELLFRNRSFLTFEDNQAKTEAENILPLATRQARAAAGSQMFYIEIGTLLDFLSTPLGLLTSSVRVEITFKPLANAIQWSAGTLPAASILSANLRMKYINCNPSIMSTILEASKKASVLFPFYDTVSTLTQLAANSTNIRFLLSEFKSITAYMGFMLRESAQVQDTTGNPAMEISNSIGFQDWNMQDRGINVVSNPDNLTPDFSKLIDQVDTFECYTDPAQRGGVDYFFIPYSFAIHPQSAQDLHVEEVIGTGYYDFSRTQSAYLVITNPTSVNPLQLNAYGWFMNVLILRNGNLTKYTL